MVRISGGVAVRRQGVEVKWEFGRRAWTVCPEEAIPPVGFVRREDADVVGCGPTFIEA